MSLVVVANLIFRSQVPEIPLTSPLTHDQQYTVVVNTFRRPDMLQKFLKNYAKCARVDSIRVVWSDMENSPPISETAPQFFSPLKPVIYQMQEEDSLNNRFRPIKNLHTDAIFSVDDDMIVPCGDLDFAFEVWRNSPRTIVGFMPRTHTPIQFGNSIQYMYNCWWKVWWEGSYSMILTKAAFLHRDYLDMYTNSMPESIRNYVDENRNCEDIAMSFLVANETMLPPIYVRGNLKDFGAFNGISTKKWTRGGHMQDRSKCLNKMVDFYNGDMPLVKGHTIAAPASSWTINQPSTWLEYFSSDIFVVASKGADEFSSQVVRSSSTSLAVFCGLIITAFVTF